MKEALHGKKLIKTGEGWRQCLTCNKEVKVLIFVEELDESFCFFCYQNRFGLERLRRRLGEIPKDIELMGFEVRYKQ